MFQLFLGQIWASIPSKNPSTGSQPLPKKPKIELSQAIYLLTNERDPGEH